MLGEISTGAMLEEDRRDEEEEMASEYPPIKEPLIFDPNVAYHYLSPYLLNIEQEQRIVTNRKENEGLRNMKNLTREQVQRYIQNQHHIAKTSEVTQMMDCIGDYLQNEGDEFFRGGELSICGSVAEGTKVSSCDEFDYQYLITLEECEAVRKPLLRTKPRSAKVESKSFFSLNLMKEDDKTELKSSEIHDRFLKDVRKGLQQFTASNPPLYTALKKFKLVKAGPAVKMVLWSEMDFVKIDITFGIKSDPLKLFKDEELTDLARSLPWGIKLDCHFICAHDYWKVSFVDTEQQLMREISQRDPYKAASYRAIKCVRDRVDIKDRYGDGILPSYPLKITFMSIVLEDSIEDIMWSMEDTSLHAIHILEEVENRGQSHQLNDLFLKGEEVMSESDRSYLESQRILKELSIAGDAYKNKENHLPHSLILLFVFIYLGTFCFLGVACFGVFDGKDHIYGIWTVMKQWLFQILNSVITFALTLVYRKEYANPTTLYKIYPYIPKFCKIYCPFNGFVFIVGVVVEIPLIAFSSSRSPYENAIVMIIGIILSQIACILPVVATGVSVLVNGKRSIHLGKNIALFNSYMSISWQWIEPKHSQHPYRPELYGSGGFTKVAKLRAYLVVANTIIVICLTLVSAILEFVLFLMLPDLGF